MIVQFRNEKVNNHGSIPITIDCNVVAFIVFEEGFHQPIKSTKHTVAAVIFVPDEGGVKATWKSAGGTEAGKAIGYAGKQMLVKILELERLLDLDHAFALVSLSICSLYGDNIWAYGSRSEPPSHIRLI
ncbi:hypothetical protein TNCV_3459771 [Trichonephila clavipes]|nr:hypothetical protein TNCV_3459771 [Trichonephila clavipes]